MRVGKKHQGTRVHVCFDFCLFLSVAFSGVQVCVFFRFSRCMFRFSKQTDVPSPPACSPAYLKILILVARTLPSKPSYRCTCLLVGLQISVLQTPFMAVTAHWIPEDKPELVSTTLTCSEFRGSHTAERLADRINEVMSEFGIKDTTVALTTDTAANIKKAGKQLLRPEWHGCTCHLLQLCALKILNEPHVKVTFAKHNRLTGHLHSSSAATEKLHALQPKVQDGGICWYVCERLTV